MNPQPDPIVGHVIAILFVCMLVIYTLQAMKQGKTTKISDNFIIGYLESDPIVIRRDNPPNDFDKFDPSTQPPNPTQPKTKKKTDSIKNQPFYVDCVDALVALGMKKRDATQKTKTIFETMHPRPTSIQSFLLIALKN